MGHGHVTPNPDGSKARCGGPAMCSKCALELAQFNKNAAKIADTGKAEAQSLSPEVWEAQQVELERLARRVAELEADHERTWRCLRDGHSAHALILRGDIAVSRRQLAHLLGDAYQELFAKLERGADTPENPQNPSVCLQEPPVPLEEGDSASGQLYGGLGDVPEWDEGWADGVTGKPQNVNMTCTHGRAWEAYKDGWEKGNRRYRNSIVRIGS